MRKLLFASTLALFAGAAQADDLLGLYAGAGITRAKVEDIFHTNFNLSNTSWKVYAGFRPLGFPFGRHPLGNSTCFLDARDGCNGSSSKETDEQTNGLCQREGHRLLVGFRGAETSAHRLVRLGNVQESPNR